MKEILDRIATAISVPLRANRTDDLGEGVIYEWHTLAFDGVKEDRAAETEHRRRHHGANAGDTGQGQRRHRAHGDAPLTGSAPVCRLNGGGWLSDGERHVRIAYYELILKRR